MHDDMCMMTNNTPCICYFLCPQPSVSSASRCGAAAVGRGALMSARRAPGPGVFCICFFLVALHSHPPPSYRPVLALRPTVYLLCSAPLLYPVSPAFLSPSPLGRAALLLPARAMMWRFSPTNDA